MACRREHAHVAFRTPRRPLFDQRCRAAERRRTPCPCRITDLPPPRRAPTPLPLTPPDDRSCTRRWTRGFTTRSSRASPGRATSRTASRTGSATSGGYFKKTCRRRHLPESSVHPPPLRAQHNSTTNALTTDDDSQCRSCCNAVRVERKNERKKARKKERAERESPGVPAARRPRAASIHSATPRRRHSSLLTSSVSSQVRQVRPRVARRRARYAVHGRDRAARPPADPPRRAQGGA